jgi:GR25 family glycosyltransferase involved in LPS biosynthesis
MYDPINAFYINLEDRTDRKRQIEGTLNNINCRYERVDAIKDKIGAIGCTKSHIKALELAIERNLQCVLIVEDDIDWVSNKVNDAINSLCHRKFDVCVLAPIFDLNKHAHKINEYFVSDITCQTAAAYIVSNHYYHTLINNFKEGLDKLENGGNPNLCAVDQYWKLLQRKDNWLFAYPTLGKQRAGYSDIQKIQTNYDSAYFRNIQVS